VPFENAAMESYPSLEEWTAAAPEILGRMLHRWQLTPGDAFVGGANGSTLRVTQTDGSSAVLKVAFPHEEGKWEAVGLEAFPPSLRPVVLAQEPWTWSLLLSEISPGRSLAAGLGATDPRAALAAAGRLHLALTASPVPDALPRLADAMRDYAAQARDRLPHQHNELLGLDVRGLVVAAIDELATLATTGPAHALLHGDFNPGNILDAGADTWVAIDPKPLVGDAAYDLWPLVSQLGSPFAASEPHHRLGEHLAIAADAAEVDAGRAARWGWARSGLNVSWLLAEGHEDAAAAEARALRSWAAVAGY